MNAKKHSPADTIDPSLNPTRKVESMTSLAAELLLQEHELDEQSGRRLRPDRPAGLDRHFDPSAAQSPPWRPSAPPAQPPFASASRPTLASQPASRPGAGRIALLVGGALLLVALSVTMTLLLSR